MGGALLATDQRVIGNGGAAGYHLCRMLMGASDMASCIAEQLKKKKEDSAAVVSPDSIARHAYHSIWTPEAMRQRNFAVFGGEFLMSLDVKGLRGFFTGFFKLPLALWGGFLAGWKGLPYNVEHESWYKRMWFGINFIVRIPPEVAINMAWNIILYCIAEEGFPLPQSVTPLCGEPASYLLDDTKKGTAVSMRYDGDWTVKKEAQQMILERQQKESFEEIVKEEEVPVQLL